VTSRPHAPFRHAVNSLGMSLQSRCWLAFADRRDLAQLDAEVVLGALKIEARERGVGRDLPTDWFTEDVNP
jgi:hypothetical protein